jgi:hypothetical protein
LGVPNLEVTLTRVQAVVFYVMEADMRLALITDRERLRAIVGAWDRTYTARRVGDAWSALRDLHAAGALNVRGFARDRSKQLPAPPSRAACERAFANIVAVLGWQGKDPKVLAYRWQQFHAALMEPAADRPSLRRNASNG